MKEEEEEAAVQGGERGRGEGGVLQFPVAACDSEPSCQNVSVSNADRAERNRMQAIKCVVVGDG